MRKKKVGKIKQIGAGIRKVELRKRRKAEGGEKELNAENAEGRCLTVTHEKKIRDIKKKKKQYSLCRYYCFKKRYFEKRKKVDQSHMAQIYKSLS